MTQTADPSGCACLYDLSLLLCVRAVGCQPHMRCHGGMGAVSAERGQGLSLPTGLINMSSDATSLTSAGVTVDDLRQSSDRWHRK